MLGCDSGAEVIENSDTLCSDGKDNDDDGAVDCEDVACFETTVCKDTPFEPDSEDVWSRKPNRGEVNDPGTYIAEDAETGAFPLVRNGKAVPLVVSADDYDGVKRAVGDLKGDIKKVTSAAPEISDDIPSKDNIVIVGTIGKSPLVNALIKDKKLDYYKV